MTSRRWALVGKRRARPSYMVCPTSSSTADGDGGVTGDPLHRLAIDQADVLELAGERSAARLSLDQGG